MKVKRRYVEQKDPPAEFYELVDVDYCCDQAKQEIENRVTDQIDEEADTFGFLKNRGNIGLEKTVRKSVVFEVCPFCGEKIKVETVEAVERKWETVKVETRERKDKDIKIPDGV